MTKGQRRYRCRSRTAALLAEKFHSGKVVGVEFPVAAAVPASRSSGDVLLASVEAVLLMLRLRGRW